MLNKLWRDETGAIVSLEIVIAATILGIGVLTGLSSLRDAAITELADLGAAVAWLNQSYTLHGVKAHSSATANTNYQDRRDFCDDGTTTTSERCLTICGDQFAAPLTGGEGI